MKASGSRILVIDDEPDLCQTMQHILTFWGHAVDTVGSAREGIQLMQATRYDLIVTDLSMPLMSGWQVVEAARAIVPPTPVLILTGSAMVGDERRAREAGVTLLHKPIRHRDLQVALDTMLADSEGADR